MDTALSTPLADTWGMHGSVGGGWMILMMLVMVLFWAAIVLGAVWLVRGGFDGWPGRRPESPTEVLQRRFAEGAISADEYRARLELLRDGAAGANGTQREEPLTAPPAAGGRTR